MTEVKAPQTRLARLAEALDAHDAHFYGGLLLVAVGGAVLSLPWTLVGVGSVLIIVGFVSARGGS